MKYKTKKLLFVTCLTAFAVLLASAIGCISGCSKSSLSGKGTEDDPFVIATKEDLLSFNTFAGDAIDGHAGKYFVLTADIDLGGDVWYPVAGGRQFAGIFDGKNHTISNCTISTETESNKKLTNVGFFSYVSGGEEAGIYNLNLDNVKLVNSNDTHNLGVLVGYADARIENCTVNAELTISGYTAYVGGIAGYSNNTITGCESFGVMNVSAVERLPGTNSTYQWPCYAGIVGSSSGEISHTTNNMKLNMSRTDSASTVNRNIQSGGIVGSANGSVFFDLTNNADLKGVGGLGGIIGCLNREDAEVSQCSNYGNLYTTGDVICDLGGIVARSYTSGAVLPEVKNCLNTGDLTALSILRQGEYGSYNIVACWVGGIIGAGNFNVSNCVSKGEITVSGANTHYVGGIAGGITGTLKNSYHQGDITVTSDSSIIAGGVLGVLQSHEYYTGLIEDLSIAIERCYNVGEVNIDLADNPLSAAANYLTGGVVGYNMQSTNTVRYCYFDQTAHSSQTVPDGFIGYIYWYGEENAGQADNVESDTIYSNAPLSAEALKGSEIEGFVSYVAGGGEDAVWVLSGAGYPILWWEQANN
ncbi:MAG: GLUG motif-containing protein [Candidatus Coproplasma sp.]